MVQESGSTSREGSVHASSAEAMAGERLTTPGRRAVDPPGAAATTAAPRRGVAQRAVPIRRAQPADADAVAVLVADALHRVAVSAWLVPEPVRRLQVLADVVMLHVEHALAEGMVWVTVDFAAAA